MTKKNISETLRRKSRTSRITKRSTRLGRTLVASADEMLAHARGEIKIESYTLPCPLDVRAIRLKVGMSQAKFAAAFALNPRTLQESEQGKAAPDGAVRAYLTVIERNPEAVVEALRG